MNQNKSFGKPWETLATVEPKAFARFRLTTGHDFLGVYLFWIGLTADEACRYAAMPGSPAPHNATGKALGPDKLDPGPGKRGAVKLVEPALQCTELNEFPTDETMSSVGAERLGVKWGATAYECQGPLCPSLYTRPLRYMSRCPDKGPRASRRSWQHMYDENGPVKFENDKKSPGNGCYTVLLKSRVTEALQIVVPEMLQKTWPEISLRLDVLLVTNGVHIEIMQ
ncbi:hypothetical protein TNCV_2549841 [Trichonephila clavipes]|nr:hypothetical protein TNCV_2549841 [Trichonephila clavipes]